VIFVDTHVFVCAVGRPHPLRQEAQNFFVSSKEKGQKLVTSSEVLQELMDIYLPLQQISTLDAALQLATPATEEVFPVKSDTVIHARDLLETFFGSLLGICFTWQYVK